MSGAQRIQAKVNKIQDHGEGIYTVRFDVSSRATRFKAGQFLHLALDDFDPTEAYWPNSRAFSIASAPRNNYLEIVYSVKGEYTTRMSRELEVGKLVWLKLPYGDFIVENYVKGKDTVVFVAGGTGISPFVPYFLEQQTQPIALPIALYYGIRDSNRFLYRNVVERLYRVEGMQVSIWSEGDDTIPPFQVTQGRFDVGQVASEIVAKRNSVCFLSGPPPMIRSFQDKLSEAGFPTDDIIVDDWE